MGARWLVRVAARGGAARAGCGVIGACVVLVFSWPAAGSAAGAAWSVQAVQIPVVSDGQFSAVSCVSPSACFALGWSYSGAVATAGDPVVYAARWTGSGWTAETVPDPAGAIARTLSSFGAPAPAMSCSTQTRCLAVGPFSTQHGRTVALLFNGSSWSPLSVPRPARAFSSELTGVSCLPRGRCVAVGYLASKYGVPVRGWVLRFARSRWSVQRIPNSVATLSGVTCTSPSACTAVGALSPSKHRRAGGGATRCCVGMEGGGHCSLVRGT
jgi:hypothetical protein